MISLRPYQHDAIRRLRESIRTGHRAPILCAPTGSGKTICFCEIIRLAQAKGSRCIVLTHRKELIEQTSAKLRAIGLDHGIIKAGYPQDRRQNIQVASVQSLVNRLHQHGRFDLVIADEAHLSIASTWMKVIQAIGPKVLIGATATPARLDGRGLGALYDDIVLVTTTADLIRDGYASPFRYFAPSEPDLAGVQTVAGEYQQDQLATAMDKPTITGSAVSEYRKRCPGVPALAFCVSVEHAEHTADSFKSDGWRAMAVSGESPDDMRTAAVTDLAAGRLDVLTSCQIFIEGLDIPNIGAVIDLAPTKSLTRYLQKIGRGMRLAPGKSELVILDHASNWERHGLPDAPREWSLKGRLKRAKAKPIAPVKLCPKCYRTVAAATSMCPECGFTFPVKPREVREADGHLIEIGAATVRERRARDPEKQSARTLDELVQLGIRRGYRNAAAWAGYVMAARQRREAAHA